MFSIEKYLQKCPAFYYHSLLMKNKGTIMSYQRQTHLDNREKSKKLVR